MTPLRIAAGLRAWLASGPAWPTSVGTTTRAFCRQTLARAADPRLLAEKVERELSPLSRRSEPLGTVLVVVSERDVLGTILALIGLCLTGNRGRFKAARTAAMLTDLATHLGVGDSMTIEEWSSEDQDERVDKKLLEAVDGVLLAGPAALIAHYRRAAPAHLRLIELGPKLSAAAIARDSDLDAVAVGLVRDVTLFEQGVCSSPQLILADAEVAEPLFARLCDALPSLTALAENERLAASNRAAVLAALGRLDADVASAFCPATGWAATLTRDLAAGHQPHKGFALISGDLSTNLGALSARHRGQLQTLAVAGSVPARSQRSFGFTRHCAVGAAHDRDFLGSHDGFLELAALVNFVSDEVSGENNDQHA